MTIFYIGLALFFIPHFYSAMRSRAEERDIRAKMGEAKYMGLYSLITLAGFVLMIWGYAKTPPGEILFEGPHDLHHYAWVFMVISFTLLAAAYTPIGYIKRTVQHPMMLAVLIWGASHLVMGGDLRKLLLFGGFTAYALISLAFGYKRGTDLKSKSPKFMGDIIAIIAGLILTGIMMHGAHLYLFKASPV